MSILALKFISCHQKRNLRKKQNCTPEIKTGSEMDWRHYDPFLGRFNAVDKLAEITTSLTPYHFANNNPVYFSDPSGLAGIQTNYGVDSFGRNRFDDYGTFITPDAREGAVSFDMTNYMDGGNGYGGFSSSLYYKSPFIGGGVYSYVYKGEQQVSENGVLKEVEGWFEKTFIGSSMDSNRSSVVQMKFTKIVEVEGNVVTALTIAHGSKLGYWLRAGRPASFTITNSLKYVGRGLGILGMAYTGYLFWKGDISTLEAITDLSAGALTMSPDPRIATVGLSYFGIKAIYEYSTGNTFFDKPIK